MTTQVCKSNHNGRTCNPLWFWLIKYSLNFFYLQIQHICLVESQEGVDQATESIGIANMSHIFLLFSNLEADLLSQCIVHYNRY